VLLVLLLSSCVVAVTDDFCVGEPVDEILIDVSRGDVTVTSAPRLCVQVQLQGAATQPLTHGVQGRTLLLQSECRACGGEIRVAAPQGVLLDVALETGDLRLESRGGEVYAAIGSGDITAVDMVSGWTELASGEGRIDATWTQRPDRVGVASSKGRIELGVPTGVYVLDLVADAGSVQVSGIDESGDANAQIAAVANRGSIEVHGH